MWTKPYGKTGKQISAVSFGGMRFENPKDIDGSAETVLRAYRAGVNYFDTAPGYCEDKSEEITGAAIRQMKPGTFYVSTKSGESAGDNYRANLERSLKRLGVEKIHFHHIWCVLTLEGWRKRVEGGAIRAAMKAKDEGLIEHMVISSHMPSDELTEVLKQAPFEGVTLGYCAINFPYRQKAVDACEKMGLGVITMNPLGGGMIPRNAATFDFIRSPGDQTVVEAAIRFNVSQPAVTSALVGCANAKQVDEAVAAVKDFTPYPAAHVDAIRQKVMTTFNHLCTGCGYCLPCPQGVNIPQLMDAYNCMILESGEQKSLRDRLRWHWGSSPAAARACSMCGACEDQCTQRLPIRERLKEIAALPDEKK